jgi:hypothetical protein
MKYRLVGDWPVGGVAGLSRSIPSGTILDAALPEWSWLRDVAPPINAQALDQEAWDWLLASHNSWLLQPKGF